MIPLASGVTSVTQAFGGSSPSQNNAEEMAYAEDPSPQVLADY
jgi:hypothetical protein